MVNTRRLIPNEVRPFSEGTAADVYWYTDTLQHEEYGWLLEDAADTIILVRGSGGGTVNATATFQNGPFVQTSETLVVKAKTSNEPTVFGPFSPYLEEARTNKLPQRQRDCETTPATAFHKTDGTVTLTNEVGAYQGSFCLGVEATHQFTGPDTAKVGAGSGETWTGSLYMKGEVGDEVVLVSVTENDGAGLYTEEAFTLTTTWTRYEVTHTTDSSGVRDVQIWLSRNAATGTAIKWYCDALQLEKASAASAWTNEEGVAPFEIVRNSGGVLEVAVIRLPVGA